MGIHRKTVAYRADDQTAREHAEIRGILPCFLDDHTSVIRFCARVTWKILCTPMTVQDIREFVQALRCMTLQCGSDGWSEPTQHRLPFPPEIGLRVRI
jgi:hypothetical protein